MMLGQLMRAIFPFRPKGLLELSRDEQRKTWTATQRARQASFGSANAFLSYVIPDLERLVKFEPDEWIYHYQLANFYFKKGSLDDAVRSNRRAVELRPDDARGHYALASCLSVLAFPDTIVRLGGQSTSSPIWTALSPELTEQQRRWLGITAEGAAHEALEGFEKTLALGVQYGKERELVERRVRVLRDSLAGPGSPPASGLARPGIEKSQNPASPPTTRSNSTPVLNDSSIISADAGPLISRLSAKNGLTLQKEAIEYCNRSGGSLLALGRML